MKTKIASLIIVCFIFLSFLAFADGIPETLAQQHETEYLGPPDVNNPNDIHYDRPPWWIITGITLPDH